MSELLSWLRAPATDRGIRFLSASGEWELWPYDRLAALARRTAGALTAAGVRPGDVVAVVEPTGPHFVGLLFGTLLAGGAVAPLPPPTTFTDRQRYAAHLRAALDATGPALVVCDRDAAARVAPAATAPLITTEALLGLAGSRPATGETGADGPPPSAPALVQCTSGTTGPVRAVRVPAREIGRASCRERV